MNKILKMILKEKQKEIVNLKLNSSYLSIYNDVNAGLYTACKRGIFANSLISGKKRVIAEIKRKSPTKPIVIDIPNPSILAEKYIAGGAAAISVLTDQKFFGGRLEDLTGIKKDLGAKCCPLLRKDFIIDPMQIVEAIAADADCILLIVSALGREKTKSLLDFTKKAGIDALVEIHSDVELGIAIEAGAEIIGINNRNLDTFEIDINISKSIIKNIPNGIIKVSESGIRSSKTARELFDCGFNAVLIGEFLSSSDDPGKLIREMIA